MSDVAVDAVGCCVERRAGCPAECCVEVALSIALDAGCCVASTSALALVQDVGLEFCFRYHLAAPTEDMRGNWVKPLQPYCCAAGRGSEVDEVGAVAQRPWS